NGRSRPPAGVTLLRRATERTAGRTETSGLFVLSAHRTDSAPANSSQHPTRSSCQGLALASTEFVSACIDPARRRPSWWIRTVTNRHALQSAEFGFGHSKEGEALQAAVDRMLEFKFGSFRLSGGEVPLGDIKRRLAGLVSSDGWIRVMGSCLRRV